MGAEMPIILGIIDRIYMIYMIQQKTCIKE